jgi:hypothetical protein
MIDSVKIGEMTYTVHEVKVCVDWDGNERPDANALVDHGKATIQIRDDLNSEMKVAGLLHEIFHAMGRRSGMEFSISGKVEERVVITYTHELLALLRHNPELVRYITDGRQPDAHGMERHTPPPRT